MKTIFIDIDGTIVKQSSNLSDVMIDKLELCPGVLEKFNEWNCKNYKIILTTGRKESTRCRTESELKLLGLFWDHLLMGLDTSGERFIINNYTVTPTCYSINVLTDKGIKDVRV